MIRGDSYVNTVAKVRDEPEGLFQGKFCTSMKWGSPIRVFEVDICSSSE